MRFLYIDRQVGRSKRPFGISSDGHLTFNSKFDIEDPKDESRLEQAKHKYREINASLGHNHIPILTGREKVGLQSDDYDSKESIMDFLNDLYESHSS